MRQRTAAAAAAHFSSPASNTQSNLHLGFGVVSIWVLLLYSSSVVCTAAPIRSFFRIPGRMYELVRGILLARFMALRGTCLLLAVKIKRGGVGERTRFRQLPNWGLWTRHGLSQNMTRRWSSSSHLNVALASALLVATGEFLPPSKRAVALTPRKKYPCPWWRHVREDDERAHAAKGSDSQSQKGWNAYVLVVMSNNSAQRQRRRALVSAWWIRRQRCCRPIWGRKCWHSATATVRDWSARSDRIVLERGIVVRETPAHFAHRAQTAVRNFGRPGRAWVLASKSEHFVPR